MESHGIPGNMHTPNSKIVSHLKNSGAVYYGKGEQKCALLGKLFKEKFHNLEEFDCPKFKDLLNDNPKKVIGCSRYPYLHFDSSHCAQRKVILYLDWLQEFHRLFDIVKD